MTKIFITGASGYIGGQVLYELAKTHPSSSIKALARSEATGKAILDAFPNVEIINGSLDDGPILAKAAAEADIVLHIASAGNLNSVKAIHESLKARSTDRKPAYWIQISGASALAAAEVADKARVPGTASDVIFDDLDGISNLRSFLRQHPQRGVDNYLLSVGADEPQINTALVFPPVIYGAGQGPVNQRSIQVPELAKATLKRGRGLQVGEGLNRWDITHVHDVGQLIVRLVGKAIDAQPGDEEIWNENGLYLTGVGETSFADISKQVTAVAAEKGYIASGEEIDQVLGDEANSLLPHGVVIYGTNARSTSRRAKTLLGWTPSFDEDGLREEIPGLVDAEAKALKLGS